MKVSELLSKASMQPVRKGRNVKWLSWVDGYLLVQFHSGARWVYGPDIPEEELAKLLRVPYPDRQFQLAVKNKFKAYKVESAA